MRAIWKGSISFGLVAVPVRLYSATSSHDVPLHQVHEADGGRIRYQRRCEKCGKVVQFDDITKAFDDGGQVVMISQEEIDELPAQADHDIEVVEFVPSEQIDPMRLDKSYFLEPEKRAVKPYALLLQALEDSERSAVVTFALRNRTRMAVLRVRDGVLVAQTMLWDDEIRTAEFEVLDDIPTISSKERELAASIIDQMATDFDPSKFRDEYGEQLRALIEAKLKAGDSAKRPTAEVPASSDDGKVVDLMEALERSVRKSREGGAAKKAPAKSTAKKAPAKKTAAKKSTAKKAPAKKTAARKSTAKKTTTKKTAAKKAS